MMNLEMSSSRISTWMNSSWTEREMLCEETLEAEGTSSTTDPVFVEDDRVLKNLLELETSYLPSASDPSNFQSDIRPAMREILSDWMFSVNYPLSRYRLEQHTCRTEGLIAISIALY